MNIIFSSLSEMIDALGEEYAQLLLESFQCSKNQDEIDFLTKKAITMEKKDLCRTYFAINNSGLLGFFTLGIKCTTISDDDKLSRNYMEKIGTNPENNVVQCFLLAQLCRSDISEKGLGINLFEEAIRVLTDAKKLIGCRAVRLDCKDDLLEYYIKLGFKFIRKNEEKDLNQMLFAL